MKAVKITLTHGRVWTVELSSGVRAQGASPIGALDKILKPDEAAALGTALEPLFAKVPDSGGDSNIARGRASG